YSYQYIEKTMEYVINVPFSTHSREMDFCGTRTGKRVDKWEKLGLTKEKPSKVNVPLIKEFPINIECKVVKRFEIGTHMIYLGEVKAVNIEEKLLKDGKLNPLNQDQIAFISGNYYKMSRESIEKLGFSTKN
ncbi:MAG: flavin reductase family protein, partial [Promethearchaeota archaeon]